jgi:hypothetical protein
MDAAPSAMRVLCASPKVGKQNITPSPLNSARKRALTLAAPFCM